MIFIYSGYPEKCKIFFQSFILSVLLITIPSISQAQETKVQLSGNGITLQAAFEQIEKQTSFSIDYDAKSIDIKKVITALPKAGDLKNVMSELLKDTGCTFLINNSHVVISPQPKGQNSSIRGTITDENGDPMPGVNIIVKGTTIGQITDINGTYTINIPDKDAVLVYSFVGYTSQEVPVSGRKEINIILKEDTKNIEEIVVIGYGSVKKSNLTGAISSVKMADIPKVATVSTSDMLTGRIPGLSIRQKSAAPGEDYEMTIRGATSTGAGNTPLYVIDGFPGGNIGSISPGDIESIEVLKDASATAIYGARAANGVILVNTKKGKAGTMSVNVMLNGSIQSISKPYDMVGAKDYMMLANNYYVEKWMADNKIAPYGNVDPSTITTKPTVAYSPDQISSAYDVTDWYDEITRLGYVNNEAVSVSGGSDKATYYFSMEHFGQQGVVLNSGLEKFLGRIAVDLNLSDWLTTGVTVSGSQQNTDRLYQATKDSDAGIIRDALMYPNYLPLRDANGDYTINPSHPNVPNPVSWKDVTNELVTSRFLVNNFWSARFLNDFVFRASWGANLGFIRTNSYYPKTHLTGQQLNSSASIKEERNNDYLLDATLTYTKDIARNHRINVMLGYAYQKFIRENLKGSNSDFLTDVFGVNNLAGGGNLTKGVESGKTVTKYLSYFGRINYDIADKYLFTFTLRADGSDRFGRDNKWGYFPSGAFAWRIIEEDFMKNQQILSNLKLRVSLGQTGNSEIGGNAYGYYATGANYVFGNELVTGVSENQLASPKLKWETTTEWNFGLDFGFFNNRLNGSFEFFNKTVKDLLDNRNVGSYYPVSTVADNLGSTLGRGIEVQLNSINIQNSKFVWRTSFNISHYYDQWKERNPFTILSVYNTQTDPLHIKWGYLSDGLIQAGESVPHMPGALPGSIRIKDLNGWAKDTNGDFILDPQGNKQLSGIPDGAIDDADKVIVCREAPKISLGLGNTFQYRNFDFSFFFYGEFGREKYNDTRQQFLKVERFGFGDNVTTDAFDTWRHDRQDAEYPSGLYIKYDTATDFWVEKANFIRLKNITLGYTLPQQTFSKVFKEARVYVDAQNLFVITDYTGSDPETDSFSAYPNQRTYSVGINLTF